LVAKRRRSSCAGSSTDTSAGAESERKKEVALLYVENQPYIHYQKGSLCFYALRDYIGEEPMNTALRAFLAKWALKGPPYPTARDLYAEFDRVTRRLAQVRASRPCSRT
jgi:aminopeptidase N